ncbi:MAG: Crp/Fnr family transcriptional regulator [Flavobacteriaceae bacterium]
MKTQIDLEILTSYGAVFKEYEKGEILFSEGEKALYYYQVISGSVKMFNTNDDGKEFTQGYFSNGQSFGEPPLFIDEKYPASAMAFQQSEVVKLSREKFLNILEEFPKIQKQFLELMARRIHNKATASKDIINQKPEFRIQAFLDTCKKSEEKEHIPFTRQEIANFTGLRVETVIRTLSKMNKKKMVEIINHKIYY